MIRDEKWFSTRPWFDLEARTRMCAADAAEEARNLEVWTRWEAIDLAAGRKVHSTPEWVTRAQARRDGNDSWQVEARARLLATAPPETDWRIEARKRVESLAAQFAQPYLRLNGDGVVRAC
jgi:hypothetical protein